MLGNGHLLEYTGERYICYNVGEWYMLEYVRERYIC